MARVSDWDQSELIGFGESGDNSDGCISSNSFMRSFSRASEVICFVVMGGVR
jgi:hypothetical protein